MRRFVALVAVASVLSGCAHVHRVNPASATELDDLNRHLHNRETSIELISDATYREGVKLRAERVRVQADSTSLFLLRERGDVLALAELGLSKYSSESEVALGTSEVDRVSTRNRPRGAFDGALIGLMIGGTGGAIWGAATGESPSLGPPSATEGAIFNGLLFGFLGLVAGTVFGGIVGSIDVYDLVDQPRDTQRPNGRR